MTARQLIWLILTLWIAVYGWSVLGYILTPATGDGFTRGLNRVSGFVQWQVVAAGLAVIIWITGRRFAIGTRARWISRGPALFALLPVVVILLVVAYLQISDWMAAPAPDPPPPRPVSEPIN